MISPTHWRAGSTPRALRWGRPWASSWSTEQSTRWPTSPRTRCARFYKQPCSSCVVVYSATRDKDTVMRCNAMPFRPRRLVLLFSALLRTVLDLFVCFVLSEGDGCVHAPRAGVPRRPPGRGYEAGQAARRAHPGEQHSLTWEWIDLNYIHCVLWLHRRLYVVGSFDR